MIGLNTPPRRVQRHPTRFDQHPGFTSWPHIAGTMPIVIDSGNLARYLLHSFLWFAILSLLHKGV